ncbi:hypothetical protein KUG12_27540 [Streptomyces sp. BV333]|nr:hypothetical protein [Streptomyces sp. BV333]
MTKAMDPCAFQEQEGCVDAKIGMVEVGGSNLSRSATRATSKVLAARVEKAYLARLIGQRRAALAGELKIGDKLIPLMAGSGKNPAKGLVPPVGGPGNPARFKATATGANNREADTEYKMLTYIANQLGAPSSVKGSLVLHSSQPACLSCTSVIGQFHKQFPNIRINYTSGRP